MFFMVGGCEIQVSKIQVYFEVMEGTGSFKKVFWIPKIQKYLRVLEISQNSRNYAEVSLAGFR